MSQGDKPASEPHHADEQGSVGPGPKDTAALEAADANAFREAQADGRVLVHLPLSEIHTDDLPRDRLHLDEVAASVEMAELKTSISARGQKEPVEVYLGEDGRYQLKKGWRRLTALRQLLAETGDREFSTVVARVSTAFVSRIGHYTDMVEENVIREDLSFAEMAQLAIAAASDPRIAETDPDFLVGRLYGSLHKMKRSYIRSFVFLLQELGPVIRWPKLISRNLGVEVARILKVDPRSSHLLEAMLVAANSPEEQAEALQSYVRGAQVIDPATRVFVRQVRSRPRPVEIIVDSMRITARDGECRIICDRDFTAVPREQMSLAIAAFEAVLTGR